jgi:hypothetical protein
MWRMCFPSPPRRLRYSIIAGLTSLVVAADAILGLFTTSERNCSRPTEDAIVRSLAALNSQWSSDVHDAEQAGCWGPSRSGLWSRYNGTNTRQERHSALLLRVSHSHRAVPSSLISRPHYSLNLAAVAHMAASLWLMPMQSAALRWCLIAPHLADDGRSRSTLPRPATATRTPAHPHIPAPPHLPPSLLRQLERATQNHHTTRCVTRLTSALQRESAC